MKPKQESKGESQFHFSCSTLNTLYSFLSQLRISATLCIGCPHLYEFLNTKGKVKSMLLDIDPRYVSWCSVFIVFAFEKRRKRYLILIIYKLMSCSYSFMIRITFNYSICLIVICLTRKAGNIYNASPNVIVF